MLCRLMVLTRSGTISCLATGQVSYLLLLGGRSRVRGRKWIELVQMSATRRAAIDLLVSIAPCAPSLSQDGQHDLMVLWESDEALCVLAGDRDRVEVRLERHSRLIRALATRSVSTAISIGTRWQRHLAFAGSGAHRDSGTA